MSRKRQQQHSEEIKSRILDISQRIISEEGMEALSIRRITNEMGYSSGSIYHYFKSKDDIILCILQERYQKIINAVRPIDTGLPPDELIRTSMKGYIYNCLEWSSLYKAMMFSSSPQVLEITAVLEEGILEKRPAFGGLIKALETGISAGIFEPCNTELTAQALWSAMFGLLSRLIIEQTISQEHRENLMNRQIDILLKGLRP